MPLQTDRPPRLADAPSSDVQTTETETPTLSDDDIFHILQTNRRRDAIRFLLERDDAVKMRDVAEYVAALENDTTVAELTSTERQRVYIPLYQSHLPKLDKEGIIEYNQSRGIVEPTETLELFRPYLELRNDEGDESGTDDGSLRTLKERDTVLAVASASLLVSSTVGTYAAVSALETNLALAAVIGAISIPGMGIGVIAIALLVLAVGTNYASSPNDPADARSPN